MTQDARHHSLDYLRGILAVSVMLYHYSSWNGFHVELLSKLGIYAVLTFYVISGISFGLVYKGLALEFESILAFFVKRIFRLLPVFWIAVLGVIALPAIYGLAGGPYIPPRHLISNLTLSFGFTDPNSSLVVGGWSIGNELVYYVSLPLLLVALRSKHWYYWLVLTLAVGSGFYQAFNVLDASRPIADQWHYYIQPITHWYLFVAGVGISTFRIQVSRVFIAIVSVLFVLIPMGWNQIAIVTGWRWFVFSALCVAIAGVTYLAGPEKLRFHKQLSFLGRASYSVYLLHPVVYTWLGLLVSGYLRIGAAILLTFLAGWLSWRYVEAPMIQRGKKVSESISWKRGLSSSDLVES